MVANNDLRKRNASSLVSVLLMPEVGVLIPIVIVCIVTTSIKKNFMTWKYFSSILRGCVFIGASACGNALVALSGETDMSLGMSGCLSGIMMAFACRDWGLGVVPSIIVCLGTGAFVGAINGFLVTKVGLSAWITTLATQFMCQGIAVTSTQGYPVSIQDMGVSSFFRMRPLGVSWMFFIFIGIIVILDIVVRKSKFGYKLRAVGGNAEAAQMAGINVGRIKLLAFVLAGVFGAIGGMFDVFNAGSASSGLGAGREFRNVICCAVGGISAGSGSIYGVGLGVLLFHVLWYALRILDINTNMQLVLIGAVLVLAMLLDKLRKRYNERKISL